MPALSLDKILHAMGADALSPSISDSQQVAKEMLRQYENGLTYKRKSEARRRQRHFDGNYLSDVKAKLRKQYAPENYNRLRKMEDISNNITRRVLDRTSLVYQEPAVREVDSGDANYQKLLRLFNLDAYMELANKLARLHQICGMRAVVRGGKPDFDYLHAGNCEVATTPENPYKPVALLYEIGCHDLYKDYDSEKIISREKRMYQYIDNANMYMVDGEGIIHPDDSNPGNENPYGEIPVTWVRSQLNTAADFWPQNPSSDLIEASEQIAVLITYANNAIKTSCYKQIYSTSDKPETISDNQVLDPVSLLQLPNGGGVLDMQINISQVVDYINFRVQQICTTYGMSAQDFNLTGNVESGYAKKLANQALINSVNQQKSFMRQAEKDVYRNLALLSQFHDLPKLDIDAELTVDFADMDFSESPQIEMEKDEQLMKLNAISAVDFYRKHVDADAQDEAAVLKVLENNKRINQQFAARGISFGRVEGLPQQQVLEPKKAEPQGE